MIQYSDCTIFVDYTKGKILTPNFELLALFYILPEVCVECSAETDYYECTNDIESTPALTDRLLEV